MNGTDPPSIALFVLLPAVLLALSGAYAAFRPPGATARSAILHFAAGVVFSVVAVELIPDLLRDHRPIETALGFALGIGAMLALRAVLESEGKEKKEGSDRDDAPKADPPRPPVAKRPIGMLVGIGVDVILDGLLLGVGFAAGAKEGRMLALALSLELIALGLATATALLSSGLPRRYVIGFGGALACLFCVGCILGLSLLSTLPTHALAGVIAFGAAALLFLVTEELLVEAHEEPETPFLTATFFAGFLIFLVLGMVG